MQPVNPEYQQFITNLLSTFIPPDEVHARPPRTGGLGPLLQEFLFNHFSKQSYYSTNPQAKAHFKLLADLFSPEIQETMPATDPLFPEPHAQPEKAGPLERYHHEPSPFVHKIR